MHREEEERREWREAFHSSSLVRLRYPKSYTSFASENCYMPDASGPLEFSCRQCETLLKCTHMCVFYIKIWNGVQRIRDVYGRVTIHEANQQSVGRVGGTLSFASRVFLYLIIILGEGARQSPKIRAYILTGTRPRASRDFIYPRLGFFRPHWS